MPLTVLINAGPWLTVPPGGYGGLENVIATLVPELRKRGVRVVLCSVGASTLAVDRLLWRFREGQYRHILDPYPLVTGIAHAHMQYLIAELRKAPGIDLIHDHQEVVGPSMLSLLGDHGPPVLHTLHWSPRRHPEFYADFDGQGRVFFNGVSESQLQEAPANLLTQSLGVIHLSVPLQAFPLQSRKGDWFVTLARCARVKGQDIAARVCSQLGLSLRMAGPVGTAATPEALFRELRNPSSRLHGYEDVRYYLDTVRIHEDDDRIRWIGMVSGPDKQALLGAARALLVPVRWNEPGATAALEALACGTPVIAMRRGALSTIVQHGVNGFLADDEEEFARLLLRASEIDPVTARRSVEQRFSSETMTEQYHNLYKQLGG